MVLTVPKTSASVSTNGQQSKPFEKKFHRPFEQGQMNSVPSEKSDRLPAHGPRDAAAKNSRGGGSSLDCIARGADAKAVDSYRMLHQQQQYRGLGGGSGGGVGKQADPKSQLHTSARKQGGGGGGLRYEEVPLNLVVTKGQNSSCGAVSSNPVNIGPTSDDEYKFSRLHRAAAQPSLPPPPSVPSSEVGFLGPVWGLVSSDDARLMPAKTADGLLGGHLAQTVALPGKTLLPPVSKLDLEAKRRAQMRRNESCNSEDEDDGNEEDEDLLDNSKDLARLLLISSGPPLEQPFTPAKSSFLAMFGLVSSDASKG